MGRRLFSLAWTALIWAAPNGFVRIFMDAGPDIYAIAPAILRTYGLSFLLLPLNIFSTYYFQSLLRPAPPSLCRWPGGWSSAAG